MVNRVKQVPNPTSGWSPVCLLHSHPPHTHTHNAYAHTHTHTHTHTTPTHTHTHTQRLHTHTHTHTQRLHTHTHTRRLQNRAGAVIHSLSFSLTKSPLWFQGVKELCSLLLGQALLLPSLKLLLESPDERLHTMALDYITTIAKVLPTEFTHSCFAETCIGIEVLISNNGDLLRTVLLTL